MMEPVIQVEDVSRWYGDVVGLSGATLELEPGVTGLLGPNGAGKSTLVRILSGQIRPSRGRVRVFGEPAWGNSKLYARLGYCPEGEAVYEGLSALAFLEAMLALAGRRGPEAVRRARSVLETVGLDPSDRRPMGAYSKGMRQRAKLGQALLHDPQVLLLDEPLNGMDPVGRRHTLDLVRHWGAEGRTVVVSSHILHEIEAMTREVALLHHGKVLAHGDVHEIRDWIEDRAHSVRLRCADPHRLAARLIELDDVSGVRFAADPKILVLETRRADPLFARLTELGRDPALAIDEILPLDDDLQSVFDYLVR